ncbi:MAG: type II toxin-antitoxin system RelE/ParE family toxin [Brachybacterium sp.]|uniref:type II toxin-antitoxin system RelE/ParE family toxin n=1 Tax=unclassified Brachybacterium TaxID=2623841 RepID=UPI003FDACBC1
MLSCDACRGSSRTSRNPPWPTLVPRSACAIPDRAERWDARQAEKHLREIQMAIERVDADPGRGRARSEIREGYVSYAIGSHAVFFVLRADHLDIVRILNQRMDPSRHL